MRSRRGGVLGQRGLQKRRARPAVYVALLGDLVEEVDGRAAALRHSDAQLAQVRAGVAGQSPPRLEPSSAHLALQVVGCERDQESRLFQSKLPLMHSFTVSCEHGLNAKV